MGEGNGGSAWTRDEITDVIESIPSDFSLRPSLDLRLQGRPAR